MKAGRTVETILNLAGFNNVKSKVIDCQTDSISQGWFMQFGLLL